MPPVERGATTSRRRSGRAVLCLLIAMFGGACAPRTRGDRAPHAPPTAPADSFAPGRGLRGTAAHVEAEPPLSDARPIRMTLYYLATEPCPDPAEVPLPSCAGGSLATVSRVFRKAAAMQGSAKLCDGRVVGLHTVHPLCFTFVPPEHPWGLTASGRSATPFRSIAVDPKVFPLGRWYFVPELVGVNLPALGASAPSDSSKAPRVHDGCVRADDVGWGVKGEMVDFFVGPKSALTALTPILSDRIFRMAPGDQRCAAIAGAFSGGGAP